MTASVEQKRRITKIKYDGKKVRVEYEKVRDFGDPDEFLVSCGDAPSRDFQNALDALQKDVNEICEFVGLTFTVRGVSISWTNDIMGACITALRHLKTANSPLVINTPHLPSESYAEGGDGPVMSEEFVWRMDALIGCAERYIDGGERAQGELFPAQVNEQAEPVPAHQ